MYKEHREYIKKGKNINLASIQTDFEANKGFPFKPPPLPTFGMSSQCLFHHLIRLFSLQAFLWFLKVSTG